jgi:hypothetical protein
LVDDLPCFSVYDYDDIEGDESEEDLKDKSMNNEKDKPEGTSGER